MWIGAAEIGDLAGVSRQAVQKALSTGRWRGVDLVIREVPASVGQGGKLVEVHVDSLPADLKAAWYLGQGIALHDRVEPGTGRVVQVPEAAAQNDPRWEARVAVARWRLDRIRAAVAHPKGSAARRAALETVVGLVVTAPDGRRKALTRSTLYAWGAACDEGGLHGLVDKPRADKGVKRCIVSLVWDGVFGGLISAADHAQVGEALTGHIRSLWASGESGWRAICEKATTRLIEFSQDLRVPAFEALPQGRPGGGPGVGSRFGLCDVSRKRVGAESGYRIIAVKTRDNAVYQDRIAPTIRRDYSLIMPREIVVGDVHPMDIMVLRADGSKAYPKAISWFDPATAEIHMTIALLEKNEGIRREHVAMAFEAMVADWGLPKLLYLDNVLCAE